MSILHVFIYTPIILLNAWHALLLTYLGRANSISQSALVNQKILRLHRIIHSVSALCLVVYAVEIARGPSFYVASFLLICAAIFDIMQVMVLSPATDHTPLKLSDKHQFVAWIMAAFYFLFAVVFASVTHVLAPIIFCFVLFLLLLFVFFRAKNFSGFARMQMIFFLAVSVIIAISDAKRMG